MRPRSDVIARRRTPAAARLIVFLLLGIVPAARAGVVVDQVRFWTAPDHTRVVLDLSGPAAYDLRRVTGPDRISVNIAAASFRESTTLEVGDGTLLRVRKNALSGRAQVVLDLAGDLRFRHFALKAADGRPDRIVIDVYRAPGAAPAVVTPPAVPVGKPAETAAGDTVTAAPDTLAAGAVPADTARAGAERRPPRAQPAPRPVTVVIDAGHGGMDPGAIRKGLREKDVVLAIALELARLVDAREGYRAVLTRKGDYFVSLADRVRIAKEAGGDLFVSVHANTHRNGAINGMEVYLLSQQKASDREARELANKENAADLVGLAPQERDDDAVLTILMDLRLSQVLTQSNRLAEHMLQEARRSRVVAAKKVKQAGFQVLRTLAMPSVLVEVAYLSNRADRALLESAEGRRKLARILCDGVLAWRGERPLAEVAKTAEWQTRYVVRRGDSLSALAQRHRTTVKAIKERNKLKTDRVMIGQKLLLP
ncbi:MAG: N-acetylmuramoyl-L-alanine amidase [Candidatus Latescibacteria bacterium]|nr:N-acetylmuramoyl-L-alanine amidase [Candidatus Latescibacterota bacterium]